MLWKSKTVLRFGTVLPWSDEEEAKKLPEFGSLEVPTAISGPVCNWSIQILGRTVLWYSVIVEMENQVSWTIYAF